MSCDTPPDRRYIEIRPSTDSLDPQTVTSHLRQLHGLGWEEPESRWQSASPPTIEILLVSQGSELSYYFAIDDPSAHDSLERTLRGALPSSYELVTQIKPADWLDDRVVGASGGSKSEGVERGSSLSYPEEVRGPESPEGNALSPYAELPHSHTSTIPTHHERTRDLEPPALVRGACYRPFGL